MFMRMLAWSPSLQQEGAWEVYIPGSTIKGAFRKRASQVLKTLWDESRETARVLDYLFGTQGRRGAVLFSDAYLADPQQPEQTWCSMDGVRMDPQTGRPVEAAKHDYLFAYGEQLVFNLQLDIQDLTEDDLPAFGVLLHLLRDFQNGDIPLGGEKTSGFGWVQPEITELVWLTGDPKGLTVKLFGERPLTCDGIWHRLTLAGEAAAQGLQWGTAMPATTKPAPTPPRGQAGFISHRAFGGYCGTLVVEAEVLTPLHVRESGEPSHKVIMADGPVNGWDFFSMAPAEAALRPEVRLYALPPRSIKGMLRHIYAIASNSKTPSPDIGSLNPVDGLFGWVGSGPNQAIMGRLAFSLAAFEAPELTWFKVPFPYGEWFFADGRWQRTRGKGGVPQLLIAKTWRLFPHAPLAPIVERLEAFRPAGVQASYCRAILPGARARFGIRFWNLEKEELQRLLWCVVLEPELAHKLGHHRYIGFGSLRLRLFPESSLIDWGQRYAQAAAPGAAQGAASWRMPLRVDEWLDPKVVAYYADLLKALDARVL
jgi:CRISPR/Cas system CSM-associated protein Csm3 (group 7 of RAMP superfamily)